MLYRSIAVVGAAVLCGSSLGGCYISAPAPRYVAPAPMYAPPPPPVYQAPSPRPSPPPPAYQSPSPRSTPSPVPTSAAPAPTYTAPGTSSGEVPPPPPSQEQPEALTRGPVHEAFAEPISPDPKEGVIAPKEPPAPVQELPPEVRPEGDNYVWVPGYWAWDSDRGAYIWVSACWRVAPPRSYWVPGYWTRVPGGWEWVPGFWTTSTEDLDYLPAPPEVLNIAPPYAAPANQIWVPPCWYWDPIAGRYILRQGYWLDAQPNWVWVPAHYIWTPRGYLFVAGRWDYPLQGRGVLFAPVYFPGRAYATAGLVFTPSVVVRLDDLSINLFAYPRYCHYYYGDYYDESYVSIGIYPWFDAAVTFGWYDPLFEHDRWRHRDQPHWFDDERNRYERFQHDRQLRPPRSWHDMEAMPRGGEQDHGRRTVDTFGHYVGQNPRNTRFAPIHEDERRRIANDADEVRGFSRNRQTWEGRGPFGGHEGATPQPGENRGGRGENVAPSTRRGEERGNEGAIGGRGENVAPSTRRGDERGNEGTIGGRGEDNNDRGIEAPRGRKSDDKRGEDKVPFAMPGSEKKWYENKRGEDSPSMPSGERGSGRHGGNDDRGGDSRGGHDSRGGDDSKGGGGGDKRHD